MNKKWFAALAVAGVALAVGTAQAVQAGSAPRLAAAVTQTSGIDVNSAQGTINWTSVHNAGIQYARRHNHAATPDQPHMQAALDALQSARNNLDKAEADKGGHRANAIQLVNDAIAEVRQGIEAAR